MVTYMEKKATIIVLSLMVTFSLFNVILPSYSAGSAVLSISPAHTSTNFPQPVTVNVTLSNVVNLNSWAIKVIFNPSAVAFSSLAIPSDNLLGPSGGWLTPPFVLSNNTAGYVTAFLALDGTQTVSGSGTLCQITFNVLQPGMSEVSFSDIGTPFMGTELLDGNSIHIAFSTLNGDVQVDAVGFQLYTFLCVRKTVAYNVTLFTNSTASGFNYNETTDTMNFFLGGPSGTTGVCESSIPIAMMNATLAVLINGSATYYSRSTDGLNRYSSFTYAQGTIGVAILTTLPTDVNGDRRVNIVDVAIVAKAFGSRPGNPRWNPLADMNGDLYIDITDISLVAKSFGRKYLPS
jgi:hypothetical protein